MPPLHEHQWQLEQMKQSQPSFNTTRIKKSKHKAVGGMQTPGTLQESQKDYDTICGSHTDMDTYSTQKNRNRMDGYDTAGRQRRIIGDTKYGSAEIEDHILAFIVIQRAKIGRMTEARRRPEEDKSLSTASAHIAGVKDLKLFSWKILQLQLEDSHVASANDFVYALVREGVDGQRNPYDLCIVASSKARSQDKYYTISAFSVSEVSTKIDAVVLLWWYTIRCRCLLLAVTVMS